MGLDNMRHVISIHDVVSDTMHQFAPTYHDYVLYSNGGPTTKGPPKKVRLFNSRRSKLHFSEFSGCVIRANNFAVRAYVQ